MELKENISTGFKNLDKLVDISKPQVIMIVGRGRDHEELSGDIANNICLKQKLDVLEIVDSRKEYLIQRMFVNEANVNYRAWNHRDKYTDEELKRIGKSTVNMIYSLKPLPIIIEEQQLLYPRIKEIKKIVRDFAEDFGDHYPLLAGIIVLDLFEMNNMMSETGKLPKRLEKKRKEDEKITLKIIKYMQKICKETNCPIIITKHFHSYDEKIQIEKMRNFNIIKKYIDTFLVTESSEDYKYNYIEVFGQKRISWENKTCI